MITSDFLVFILLKKDNVLKMQNNFEEEVKL